MSATGKTSRREKLLRGACYATLLALVLMAISLFWPKPLAVIVAMSLGQVLGTLSLAMFGYVVVAEFRKSKILEQTGPLSAASTSEKSPTKSKE